MILRIALLCIAALWASAQSPPPAVASDAQIEATLREKLSKSVIGKDGFTAKVKAGVVYWEGSTSIAQHKGAATRMAKSSGARRVVNNIRVSGAKPKSPPPPPSPPTKPAPAKPTAQSLPPPNPEPPPLKRVAVRWVPVLH